METNKKIDRCKLRENILYYASLRDLQIGEIEKAIGRRAGIVSRWANKKTDNVPLDDIYNISLLLNVSVEELINTDVESLLKLEELKSLKEQRELIDKQIRYLENEKK